MSAATLPSGDLGDVECELNMLTDETALLPFLRPHLDPGCWPVDQRLVATLENVVAHASAALDAIRERDDRELAALTAMTEAP